MHRTLPSYIAALMALAGVVWVTATFLPVLGLASAAMLFLLPVLFAAARGGVGPGLFAALAAASAYNFFLLPPRYTFRIHAGENVVSVAVLVAVALVTSRLATRLRAREAEALERARLSGELAELSAVLAGNPAVSALQSGVDLVASRYGALRLLDDPLPADAAALWSSLDLAAAAWALHNGDITGHATDVMPAADWTFLPMAPRNRRDGGVAALARPTDGTTRTAAELGHLAQLALVLGQCRDRDALETERRARELLAETDRLRRTLLAALSHDLRTPLTVLTGRLDLLARDHPAAVEARAAAARLERMVRDLLEAARIEDGSLAPVRESVDPVDAVGAAFDGQLVPPGLAVERAVPADLPFVAADPVLLHHILANLIDNALRHARARIVVQGRVDNGAVLLSISDDGVGVPQAERDRIFERFARIEGSDRTSGSGLGLAIVKGLADAMDMTVTVDDAPGGGARFTLAMPLAGIGMGQDA